MSYSSSIVTVAESVAVSLCEIFSVKEWRDLENQVMGPGSFKVTENGAVR